ncbi:glycosyltransferase family 32 protein [Candidatus Neptunochlamydia vexilliferae]|uniref:Subversion of eukaryotic traffic protein A n=1 Tax=Candidatus Neptunichlamydia vexilliferae TaxID=1651774 RepID=A0ABS0AYJ0_9BACT|nr:glycosyltransferase [Candidatus Neptunochlamydia vexilliferae]MBF5059034.1 hypothetical protein [Candidatus Neptunochlamydia vexilliferae]
MRLLILSLLLLFAGCEKQSQMKQTDDFNTLMGAEKSVWQFIKTHEDYENIHSLRELYEKNKDLQFLKTDQIKIPKVIHFIWLGPNPFPKESLDNVKSWVEHHPDWTFKFWTDRRRALPHRKMELKFISDFKFQKLKTHFEASDNYAEKSDLMRYELLYQEGGLYVDHDVKCFNPFDSFNESFDLYCGIETPHEPIISSSVSVCNNVIGSRPGHPVLKRCIDLIESRWDTYSLAYPGNDKESIIYRVAHRTFAPFDMAVRELGGKGENKDIAFPAAYFNRIDEDFALFAHHYYASTWFADETKFERNVRRRLISISRKNNQILLFNGVILSANVLLFACLFFQYRTIRRKECSEKKNSKN